MRNDLHVTGIRLKKLSYLEKRLLIRTVFVLIDVKTESMCFVRSIYLHVSAVFITKQKSLGWNKTSKQKRTFEFIESIGRKDQLNIHRLSSSGS